MLSKAKPTYMRPVLEDAISKGAFTRDARKAARWALVTIDDLTARLAAAEAERDVERRDRTAAEFEMLADRELLRELYEHEINEYGRWTAGMCQRVCVAAKGGRDE